MRVYDLWHRHVDGRKVRSPLHGKGLRWQARWRDADQVQRKQSFASRDEAEAFLAKLRTSPATKRQRMRVRDMWAVWIAGKAARKPSTLVGYKAKWRLYVEPRWGPVLLSEVRHSDVAAWLAQVTADHSATTARQSWTVLHGILQAALRDGVLVGDPCAGIRLPQPPRDEVRPLTAVQVRALIAAAGAHGLLVETLVSTGLRWGEMAGLNVEDVDVARRRLRVARGASLEANRPVLLTTKTGRARWVPLAPGLADRLGEIKGDLGDPLFRTRAGGRWRYRSWHRQWQVVCKRAGLVVTTHQLRHTAVSLAIAAGANVKQVQAMVGHDSGTLTIDRYGHLFPDGMDDLALRIADALNVPASLRLA